MVTEYIFASSFFAIIFMLGGKLIEERFGEFHWWSKMADWADRQVHRISSLIIGKYDLYKKIASLFFFEFLPAYFYRKLVEWKDYVYKKYYSSANNLRGEKRMIRSNGTVSDFLQNIKKEEEKPLSEIIEENKELK